MSIPVLGDTFWILTQKEEMTLFNDRGKAIGELKRVGDVSKVRLLSIQKLLNKKQETEWQVAEVSWKDIAAILLKEARQ